MSLEHSSLGSHATEMDFFIMSCENKKKFKVHSFTVCSLLRLISSPFMTSFLLICLSGINFPVLDRGTKICMVKGKNIQPECKLVKYIVSLAHKELFGCNVAHFPWFY